MTPEVKSIPQYIWTFISENISVTTINRLSIHFNFYYTTRSTGETAPDPLIGKTLPKEAVDMFPTISDEFILPVQTCIDLYVICFSRNDAVTTPGSLLVRDGVGSVVENPIKRNQTVIQKFNQVTNSTTLSALAVLYEYTVTVTSTTGIIVGSHLILFSTELVRFTSFTVLGIAGNVITLDSQLDAPYPIGTFADVAFTDMAVDGSITPQVFGLRGLGTPPGVALEVGITRILITCFTDSAVSLAKFGDLPKLTRGLLLRDRNGETFNIFNVKDNGEIGGIMLDWIPYTTVNPQQGQHGFTARLTFTKLAAVKHLKLGQDLEVVVQDPLQLLASLEIVAEGVIN